MRSHEFWTDRLSEALDGTLPPEQSRGLEEHLSSCPACRQVRDELAEVRRRARALGSTPPGTDLWTRIAPALTSPSVGLDRDDKVIPRHAGPETGPPVRDEAEPGRWFAPSPLWAAAAALVLIGAGAMGGAWVTRLSVKAQPTLEVVAVGPTEQLLAAAGSAVEPSLFTELSTLEEALRLDLGRLDPETRSVILTNLQTIDRAIRESVGALQADPESRYLRGHLGSALERKVGYLQSVTRLLES